MPKPRKTRRWQMVVVANDFHVPFYDEGALALSRRFLRSERPDWLILNGDFIRRRPATAAPPSPPPPSGPHGAGAEPLADLAPRGAARALKALRWRSSTSSRPLSSAAAVSSGLPARRHRSRRRVHTCALSP